MFNSFEDKPDSAPYSDKEWVALLKDYHTFRLDLVRQIIFEAQRQKKHFKEIEIHGFEGKEALALYAAGNIDLPLFYMFQMARKLGVDLKILFIS